MKSGKLKCHHSRPPERLALLLPSASNMPCHSRGRGGEEMQWGWRRRRRRPGEGTKSVVSIAATVDAPIHLEDLSGRNKFTNEIHALHRKCADHPIKVSERCQWANPIPGLFTPEGGVRTHVATFLSFSKKPHRRRDGEGGSLKPPLQMPPSPPNRRPNAVAVLELLAAAIVTNPTFPPLPTGRRDLPHSDAPATARKDHIFFPREGRERVSSVFHSIFFFFFGDGDGNAPSRGNFFSWDVGSYALTQCFYRYPLSCACFFSFPRQLTHLASSSSTPLSSKTAPIALTTSTVVYYSTHSADARREMEGKNTEMLFRRGEFFFTDHHHSSWPPKPLMPPKRGGGGRRDIVM